MILLKIEKDGKWFFEYPVNRWGVKFKRENNGKIYIKQNGIEFLNKKTSKIDLIKFENIKKIEELSLSGPQVTKRAILIEYDYGEVYLLFFSRWSGHRDDLHDQFLKTLKEALRAHKLKEGFEIFKRELNEFIRPYDEITFEKVAEHFGITKSQVENEIKKMLENGTIEGRLVSDRIVLREPTPKFEQTVYITIPPRTKLTALRCPSCQAPLDYMPPCKCEHCGVMIELMK